jgi:hypothetical protein
MLGSLALAVTGCGGDSNGGTGTDLDRGTATLKFCNSLGAEVELSIGKTNPVRLRALPNECSTAVGQPCSTVPAGTQDIALLSGGLVVFSQANMITAGSAIVVTAKPDAAGKPGIGASIVASPTICASETPFGSGPGPGIKPGIPMTPTTPGTTTPGTTTPGTTTPGTTTPTNGKLTCSTFVDCLDACKGDMACKKVCVQKVSDADLATYNALVTCVQSNMCKDDACLMGKCGTQYNACFTPGTKPGTTTPPPPPPPPPPSGQQDCTQLDACYSSCARDTACQQDCLKKASPAALASYKALTTCDQVQACMGSIGCWNSKCSAEYKACFMPGTTPGTTPPPGPPPPTGQLTCSQFVTCGTNCAKDAACIAACEAKTSKVALDAFDAVVECNRTNACMGDPSCLMSKCAAQYNACFMPGTTPGTTPPPAPPPPTGQLTCAGLIKCRGACNGAAACLDACDKQASPTATAAFDTILACVKANACKDGACIDAKCAAELAACNAGG